MTRPPFLAALACLLLAGCADSYSERTIDGKECQCRYKHHGFGNFQLIECIPLKAFIREKPNGCADD